MWNEIDVLRDVSNRLDHSGIDYMLSGSLAMNYYAEPRMTRDIDMVIALKPADADKIISIFSTDYYLSEEAVREALTCPGMFNLIHNESVIKVDCIVRKTDPYRIAEFSRREQVRLNDFDFWIVSKEDLILSKLWWCRESRSDKQISDIRNLIKSPYDKNYLSEWLRDLQLESLWNELTHE